MCVCVHIWTLQQGLLPARTQRSDLCVQGFRAAELSVAAVADSGAAAGDCLVPSCHTGVILSSGAIHNTFAFFSGINGNKITNHFDIFLALFYCSV